MYVGPRWIAQIGVHLVRRTYVVELVLCWLRTTITLVTALTAVMIGCHDTRFQAFVRSSLKHMQKECEGIAAKASQRCSNIPFIGSPSGLVSGCVLDQHPLSSSPFLPGAQRG